MKKIIFIICSLFFCLCSMGQNLIKNGGFETGWSGTSVWNNQVQGWAYNGGLQIEKEEDELRPGTDGSFACKVHAYRGALKVQGDDPLRGGAIPVKAGKTYILSIWYYSNKNYLAHSLTMNIYKREANEDKYISSPRLESFTTQMYSWEEYTQEIKIPNEAGDYFLSLSINIPYKNGAYVIFDDISIVEKTDGEGAEQKAPAPNVKVTPYQRGIELLFDKSKEDIAKEGIVYELKVNGQTTTINPDMLINNVSNYKAPQAYFIIPNLFPNNKYDIEIVSKIQDKLSAPTGQSVNTLNFEVGDINERVPYIASIGVTGTIHGRILPLVFNDLTDPKAKITYKIDGETVEPNNLNCLVFPKFKDSSKNFKIELHIVEGNGNVWDITYKVGVIDINK